MLIRAAIVLAISASMAFAQKAEEWTPPRTADGQPDLQGVWTNATITPFERPAQLAGKAFLTEQEAAELEKQSAQSKVDRPPAAGDVGNYNQVWFDSGTKVVGTRQTSLVVDPPDGKVPVKPAAEAKRDYDLAHIGDSYEYMSIWDRCITRGVPGRMFPAGYNNAYQIVQSPGYVVIMSEMIHDARVIPLDGRAHAPAEVRSLGRRFARPLGRQHAGGRYHQFQRQGLDRHQRRHRTNQGHPAERGSARRRAIHSHRTRAPSSTKSPSTTRTCTPNPGKYRSR